MKEEMLDPKYHLPYTLSQNAANIIVQLFTVKPEQRPKISDIRQYQWLKMKEEFGKITPSLETLWNNLNPSIVVAMGRMGYHPKDISDSLREKKFNNIMATYLILKHISPCDHYIYAGKFLPAHVTRSPADALTSFPTQRGLSELALPVFLEEHQVHDEKASRKKRMRSLSMPASLCCQQKGKKHPPPATKLAHKVTYLKSRCLALDSMICNCSSSRYLSSEIMSSASFLSCETPQDMNTPNISSDIQSSGSYREVPHLVNTTATYDIQRGSLQTTSKNSFGDVLLDGIPEIQTYFLQATSKKSFEYVSPEGIPEIQRASSGWEKSKTSFEDDHSEDKTKIQKPSLQETSKNSFHDVPPEEIDEIQRSSLQPSSQKSFDNVLFECIPEIQRCNSIDVVLSNDICEIPRPFLQETFNNIFDDVPPEEIPEIQRPSIPATSKNSFEDVPPRGVTSASDSSLTRCWKRMKKRIENCLRRLCCCVPASKRSHVSQKEVETVEVESNAVTHMQCHGVPRMHSCVS
ncbi:Sperm motility kinase X [Cricetulus griseus]|uniref:non-specific serine/threonine protein kinase n=1 Tax=Cricetulus griseus TaxID=10029 RepID=G3HN34_CRIGR|nr:Sperm motility kinase X [Cricetulus griseus]